MYSFGIEPMTHLEQMARVVVQIDEKNNKGCIS